ncbi:hypothetical protein V1515DRAFT_579959 [Lipomyces mesembrius]
MPPSERTTNRCKRLDYRALDDGSDDEAAIEDRVDADMYYTALVLDSRVKAL